MRAALAGGSCGASASCAFVALVALGGCAGTQAGAEVVSTARRVEATSVSSRVEAPRFGAERAEGATKVRPAPVVAAHARAPRPDRAVELDLDVTSFVALSRALALELGAPSEGPRFWPEKVRAAWARLVVRLEDELGEPPGDYPRPLVVRSRVALEAELDRVVARHGPPPDELAEGWLRVSRRFDEHLRSPESPSTEPPEVPRAFAWPLVLESAPIVTSGFGPRANPLDEGGSLQVHTGIDLDAPVGTLVVAAAPGRVAWVGWMDGTGNTVIVHHGGGWASLYAHLHEAAVSTGARVEPGTVLGYSGRTGRSTGPHLHFELRRRGVPVDPRPHLPRLQ